MDKKVVSENGKSYIDYLTEVYGEGYKFIYFGEENGEIQLTLNIDCEVYVLGKLYRDEILDSIYEKPYVDYGYDSQFIFLRIVNKDKFFDKYVVPLKKRLKESSIGKYIQAINFYRKMGSEIYPPEVSISIKPDVKFTGEEWFEISIELMNWILNYQRDEGLNNLEFRTPMSSMNEMVFNN